MNTIAWNSTEMEIIVKMKDVGLIPPGRSGEGRSAYKKEPWSHMNPYHISCHIQLPEVAGQPTNKKPASVKLGATDIGCPKMRDEMSSSGAQLYVQAKTEWPMPALRVV